MRFRGWILALGLLALFARPGLAAEGVPVLTRFPSGVVHAGDVIELEWSRPSRAIHELEIVLAVGEDRRFTIRVSPELERYRNHWSWTVPELVTDHARLSIRYGEEDVELLSTPTPEFRIAPRAIAPLEPATAPLAPAMRRAWITHPGRALDWWDEGDAAPSGSPVSSLGAEPALASGGLPASGLVNPRRGDEADAPCADAGFLPVGVAKSIPTPPSCAGNAAPRSTPLRE
ncbi:MAG: hypothetical protein ABI960_00290 [Candidatus Eisenbacteria bacterium]